MAKKKDSRKIVEKHFKLNITKSNFYPSHYGGEDEAYDACKLAAIEKPIYWNKDRSCWYYYFDV
jgi:hypothetical protein